MSEHYTKNTVRTLKFCETCGKKTMHRVDSGRIGPCENSHAKPVTKKNENVIYGDHKLPF